MYPLASSTPYSGHVVRLRSCSWYDAHAPMHCHHTASSNMLNRSAPVGMSSSNTLRLLQQDYTTKRVLWGRWTCSEATLSPMSRSFHPWRRTLPGIAPHWVMIPPVPPPDPQQSSPVTSAPQCHKCVVSSGTSQSTKILVIFLISFYICPGFT